MIDQIIDQAENEVLIRTGIRLRLKVAPLDMSTQKSTGVMAVVAKALDVHPDIFKLRSKKKDVVVYRQILIVLMYTYFPGWSQNAIGRMLGGLDHTSVRAQYQRAKLLLSVNDEFLKGRYLKAEAALLVHLEKYGICQRV